MVNDEIVTLLQQKFESNSKLTSGQVFRQLVEEKIRKLQQTDSGDTRTKNIEDMMALVHACVHDHVPKNLKAKVKRAQTPHGTGIEAVIELKKIFDSPDVKEKMNISIEIALTAFVCGCLLYTSPSPRDKRQ